MIEESPERAEIYARRGLAYADNAQYRLALTDYRKASAMGSPRALNHDIGVVYYRMGNFDQALQHFDAFLLQSPDSFATYEYRARVKRDMCNYRAAVADLERYFELTDSPNPGHYVSAADMLAEIDEAGPEAALALLDKGIEALGVVPQLQRRAIVLERRRGRIDLAIVRMQTLESVLGTSPFWQVDMAELLMQANKKTDAISLLNDARSQLDALRKNPARATLLSRAAKLQAALKP